MYSPNFQLLILDIQIEILLMRKVEAAAYNMSSSFSLQSPTTHMNPLKLCSSYNKSESFIWTNF